MDGTTYLILTSSKLTLTPRFWRDSAFVFSRPDLKPYLRPAAMVRLKRPHLPALRGMDQYAALPLRLSSVWLAHASRSRRQSRFSISEARKRPRAFMAVVAVHPPFGGGSRLNVAHALYRGGTLGTSLCVRDMPLAVIRL